MMELPDIADFVGAWPPFDRLDREGLLSLCAHIEISYEPVGNRLLEFEASNDQLHMVRKGAIGLYDENGGLVDKRGEGGLFGYPSLLTGRPAQLAVDALEDTLVYHIPGRDISKARALYADFDRFFLNRLVDRVSTGLQLRTNHVLGNKLVKHCMSTPAVSIDIDSTIGDAAAFMTARRVSALTVTQTIDQLPALCGIITDRDFRERVVHGGLSGRDSLKSVMTLSPWTSGSDEPAYQAQLTMLEKGVHHLPVVDADRLVGLITLSDILRAQNSDPISLTGELRRAANVEELADIAKKRFDLFVTLVDGGVDSVHVMRVMTAITDATTHRLVQLAHEQMGPAPMKYGWICLGSEARREQTGKTDQDNGLVLEREPDESEAAWFAKFTEFVCTGLDWAGFVFCPGDVMAMNADWRLSVKGWQNHFHHWITEPEPKALMFASIFFDQRCVAGDADLVRSVRSYVFDLAKGNSLFLAHMAGNALEQSPPISFFRQFILEDDGAQHEGLNLKLRGVVPIVSIARLKALEFGIENPETEKRLQLAAKRNVNQDDISDLIDAMDLINRIRNEQQADTIRKGDRPNNLVSPASLSPLTQRHLKAAFSVVRRAQQSLVRNYRIG